MRPFRGVLLGKALSDTDEGHYKFEVRPDDAIPPPQISLYCYTSRSVLAKWLLV